MSEYQSSVYALQRRSCLGRASFLPSLRPFTLNVNVLPTGKLGEKSAYEPWSTLLQQEIWFGERALEDQKIKRIPPHHYTQRMGKGRRWHKRGEATNHQAARDLGWGGEMTGEGIDKGWKGFSPCQSGHDPFDIWPELPPTPRVGVDLTEMTQNNWLKEPL